MTMTLNTRKKLGRGESFSGSRRQAVMDLVANHAIGSQAELADLLSQRGFNVTQATLSRDLKALGIGKIPAGPKGYAYVLPTGLPQAVDAGYDDTYTLDALISDVKVVNNLVLVSTPVGSAHNVSRAIARLKWDDVEGTISGDDTVMVVTRGAEQALQFVEQLKALRQRRTA